MIIVPEMMITMIIMTISTIVIVMIITIITIIQLLFTALIRVAFSFYMTIDIDYL